MCRLSGVAQRITPQLLQLRQPDQDNASGPENYAAAMADIGRDKIYDRVGETYFRADGFCKHYHDDLE